MKYAWTTQKLSEQSEKSFLSYIKNNENNLIQIDKFVFDKESLLTNVTMSQCLSCGKFHTENCCSGSSHPMEESNEKDVKSILSEVALFANNDILTKRVSENKAITNSHKTSATTSEWYGKKQNHCIFSVDIDGKTCCAIHAYCLKNNLSTGKYKPWICSLYPVFGIEYNDKIYLFSITKKTIPFTMYHYSITRRICVNEINLKRLIQQDNINKSVYLKSCNISGFDTNKINPCYIEQESVLRYFCGDTVYEELKEMIQK